MEVDALGTREFELYKVDPNGASACLCLGCDYVIIFGPSGVLDYMVPPCTWGQLFVEIHLTCF